MKTLYLKKGLSFNNVEVFEKICDFGKILKVIKLEDAVIINGGFNNSTVHFTADETAFYVVSGVAEIIEHFDWYFNNLK